MELSSRIIHEVYVNNEMAFTTSYMWTDINSWLLATAASWLSKFSGYNLRSRLLRLSVTAAPDRLNFKSEVYRELNNYGRSTYASA